MMSIPARHQGNSMPRLFALLSLSVAVSASAWAQTDALPLRLSTQLSLPSLTVPAQPSAKPSVVTAQTSAQPAAAPAAQAPAPAPSAAAQGAPIGYVKTVSGSAFVVTGGQEVKALVGTPVAKGSVLKTGAASSLGVSFIDSSLMSFGPNSELKVDEYLYAPAQGQLKFGSSLLRGTLNYISGVIAKLRPDAVTVNTPTGMIGVRGTQFAVKVEPGEK